MRRRGHWSLFLKYCFHFARQHWIRGKGLEGTFTWTASRGTLVSVARREQKLLFWGKMLAPSSVIERSHKSTLQLYTLQPVRLDFAISPILVYAPGAKGRMLQISRFIINTLITSTAPRHPLQHPFRSLPFCTVHDIFYPVPKLIKFTLHLHRQCICTHSRSLSLRTLDSPVNYPFKLNIFLAERCVLVVAVFRVIMSRRVPWLFLNSMVTSSVM